MISIVSPLPVSALLTSSAAASAGNLLTASPREVWRSAGASDHVIDIDLGAPVDIDTIYLGGLSVPGDCAWSLSRATSMGDGLILEGGGAVALPKTIGVTRQTVIPRSSGVATRFLRLVLSFATPQSIDIGNLVVGKSWRHAYAYGAGRTPVDLSRRTDLQDGGFGIDAAAMKAQFRWNFVDLDAAAADELWAIVVGRATSHPVVVIEDAAISPPPDPSVHYGLFNKFEPWERSNAADTTWALSMTEWR